MQPYSLDFRIKIVQAYENKENTYIGLSERFSVSESFITKLLRLYRATGSVEPRPHGGGNPGKISSEMKEKLLAWVRETPDITLEELKTKLTENQYPSISVNAISVQLRKCGLSFKKRFFMQANRKQNASKD